MSNKVRNSENFTYLEDFLNLNFSSYFDGFFSFELIMTRASSSTQSKGVGMIRVDFGPISETVYIDIILNTIIER